MGVLDAAVWSGVEPSSQLGTKNKVLEKMEDRTEGSEKRKFR